MTDDHDAAFQPISGVRVSYMDFATLIEVRDALLSHPELHRDSDGMVAVANDVIEHGISTLPESYRHFRSNGKFDARTARRLALRLPLVAVTVGKQSNLKTFLLEKAPGLEADNYAFAKHFCERVMEHEVSKSTNISPATIRILRQMCRTKFERDLVTYAALHGVSDKTAEKLGVYNMGRVRASVDAKIQQFEETMVAARDICQCEDIVMLEALYPVLASAILEQKALLDEEEEEFQQITNECGAEVDWEGGTLVDMDGVSSTRHWGDPVELSPFASLLEDGRLSEDAAISLLNARKETYRLKYRMLRQAQAELSMLAPPKACADVTAKVPTIGKIIESLVREQEGGVNMWRSNGTLVWDGNKKIDRTLSYRRLAEAVSAHPDVKSAGVTVSKTTVFYLCAPNKERHRSALRHAAVADVKSRRARKGLIVKPNADTGYGFLMYSIMDEMLRCSVLLS